MRKADGIWLPLLGVAILATFSASNAWAKDCGDKTGQPGNFDVPCDCGDTVTTDTILKASDPVVTKVCFPTGLFVAGGVTLDASSAVIRCHTPPDFVTTGFWIIGNDATIDGGIIQGCGNGIFGVTDGSTIERVTARGGSSAGINIHGDGNTLLHNLCDNNAFDGIFVEGAHNTLERNYCKGNGSNGIFVLGGPLNNLKHNQGRNNSGHGVLVLGDGNTTDERNYGTANAARPDCLFDGNPPVTADGKYC